MMQGYDKQEAVQYVLSRLDKQHHGDFASMLDELVSDMIDFDMAFMHETGVIDIQGNAGENYYDDDDAFEYILDHIATKHKMSADIAMKAAALLDDFLDHQQGYMEKKGLVDWD